MARLGHASALPDSECCGGRAGREIKLEKNICDVALDGVLAQPQPPRDDAVAEPIGNESQHFPFAGSQDIGCRHARGTLHRVAWEPPFDTYTQVAWRRNRAHHPAIATVVTAASKVIQEQLTVD